MDDREAISKMASSAFGFGDVSAEIGRSVRPRCYNDRVLELMQLIKAGFGIDFRCKVLISDRYVWLDDELLHIYIPLILFLFIKSNV